MTTETKLATHTPEPWRVEVDDKFHAVKLCGSPEYGGDSGRLIAISHQSKNSTRERDEADFRRAAACVTACKRMDDPEEAVAVLLESLDPHTLEAIADEIGGEFRNSARADSLRRIARIQRSAIAKAEGK